MPLHPPVITQPDSSTDEEEPVEEDPVQAGLNRISSLKSGIRKKRLKIEHAKVSIAEFKKLKKRKMAERDIVKEVLESLMVKQATYERYLRESTEFVKGLKENVSTINLDAAKSKKGNVNYFVQDYFFSVSP